jgi:hypothetical protein
MAVVHAAVLKENKHQNVFCYKFQSAVIVRSIQHRMANELAETCCVKNKTGV